MSTFANSEDQDEMPHNAAFHQDLSIYFGYGVGVPRSLRTRHI